MDSEIPTLELQFVRDLWLGTLDTPFGIIELVVSGTPEAPNPAKLAALEAFLPTAVATIDRLRRKLSFRFLWHPIRLAVNNQNRVGVQFRNRLTGAQDQFLFADDA